MGTKACAPEAVKGKKYKAPGPDVKCGGKGIPDAGSVGEKAAGRALGAGMRSGTGVVRMGAVGGLGERSVPGVWGHKVRERWFGAWAWRFGSSMREREGATGS